MKILYAIQGTGNGHISRAMSFIPELEKRGEVDILLSGYQSDISLPWEVKYKLNGLSFIFGKKGGIDYFNTLKKSNFQKFLKEVSQLPIKNYDLVISDFEPISAWACSFRNKICIGLSNQAAVLHPESPQPNNDDVLGKMVLKFYAPANITFGFHFKSYSEKIYTPVIREAVRALKVTNEGHYTVYLPAYDDERIIKMLEQIPQKKWEVFTKHNNKKYIYKNIIIKPIESEAFLNSLAACEGVLCAAGFATPSEALFLRKKLMVIPMKKQYEQQCNALALAQMGVPVIRSLKDKWLPQIRNWINKGKPVNVDYPDNAALIIGDIFDYYESAISKKVVIEA